MFEFVLINIYYLFITCTTEYINEHKLSVSQVRTMFIIPRRIKLWDKYFKCIISILTMLLSIGVLLRCGNHTNESTKALLFIY